MLLKDIAEKLQELNVYENRGTSDDFCEFVFLNTDIDAWEEVLTNALGAAVKPAGVVPTNADEDITEQYGGIMKGQTLFKKEYEDVAVVAMLWPWQDNAHITLKLFLSKKEAKKEDEDTSLWDKLFG